MDERILGLDEEPGPAPVVTSGVYPSRSQSWDIQRVVVSGVDLVTDAQSNVLEDAILSVFCNPGLF